MALFRKNCGGITSNGTCFGAKGTAIKCCATLGANRSEPLGKTSSLNYPKGHTFEVSDYSVLEARYSPGGRTRTPFILFP
jgi:hypothetical protein